MNFTSPVTSIIVLPDTEDRMIVPSFLWTKHQNVTDRQTDNAVAITAVCIASNMRTRCKNTADESFPFRTVANATLRRAILASRTKFRDLLVYLL